MTTRRRLLGVLLGLAGALLIGRLVSTVLAERWYAAALGVSAAVDARLRLETWLRLGTALTAFGASLASLLAVRQSIVSMVVPRQLGNLIIGEAVPSALLTAGAVGLAAVVGIAGAVVEPDTTAVQLALDGVRFGVEDPYLFRDVGFYVAWLPFERWLFETLVLVYASVLAPTLTLYLATPSVRREGGRWRLSVWVRRHVGILGGAGILLWAWSWRLDAFALVAAGDGSFGAVAHRVLLPALQVASWVGVSGAAVVAYAAWHARGQVLLMVLAILLLAGPLGQVVLRQVGDRQGDTVTRGERDAPYVLTRRAFAGWGQDPVVGRLAAMGAVAADASIDPPADARANPTPAPVLTSDRERFRPGAGRYALVADPDGSLRAPSFVGARRRVALAWALRTPGLAFAGRALDAPRLLTHRDPVDRVQSVYPFLVPVGPARREMGPTGPVWAVDLFIVASDFPLQPRGPDAVHGARYVRRAGVGMVDAATGAVGLRLTGAPDPVLRAWMAIAPDLFAPARLVPTPAVPAEDRPDAPIGDARLSALRVAYDSAETASRRGDLRAFESAWARIGRLLGRLSP